MLLVSGKEIGMIKYAKRFFSSIIILSVLVCVIILWYKYGLPALRYGQYESETKHFSFVLAATALITLTGALLIYAVNTLTLQAVFSRLSNKKNWYQTTIILSFFFAFMLSAVINKMHSGVHIPASAYIFLVLSLIFMGIVIGFYIRQFKCKKDIKIESSIWKDKGLMAVAIIPVLCRLPMLIHIQMWDGAIYYAGLQNACLNFNFTLSSVWQGFRLAGHYTLAYALFASIGEFLAPASVAGVLTVTLFMSAAALVCIYKMLRGYWCEMMMWQATIVTLIVSIVPVFWGMFADINLDYFLLVFFIYLLYAEYKEWKVLRLFWIVAIMLTKETGWFIIAGYGLVYGIKLWKQSKEKKVLQRILFMLEDSLVKSMLMGLIAISAYVVVQGSLFVWMNIDQNGLLSLATPMVNAAEGQNFILFLLPFLLHKIMQLFTLNFTWIPTLAIIFCMIRRRSVPKGERKEIRGLSNMSGAMWGFLLFSVFSTAVFSSALTRYTIFSTVFLWLIAFILLYESNVKFTSLKEKIAVSVIAFLLCVQTFYFIDPISNLFFDRLDTGKGKILSGEQNYSNYGDTLVNNYRYSYIISIIDRMLAEADYDAHTQVIVPYERDYLCIPGDDLQYTINWDARKKQRTFGSVAGDNSERIPIGQIQLDDIKEMNGEGLSDRAIVYFMPYIEWDETGSIEELSNYYEIGERKELYNWGGCIVYYILEHK